VSGISRDEVAHLAHLARLELTTEELDHFAPQLDAILDHVSSVAQVAADDVPPTAHPVPVANVVREDVAGVCLTADEALAGAPAVEQQRFKVPQILGDEQ
jgi:aspartyl-tRNA(Asn)/glutamyl-tRNA(Gln) amidotransferase subunit C